MKAIIGAGGRGTRMRPITFSTNKHLIPLANKPLIFYPLETIAASGIKDVGIVYNPGQLAEFQNCLGDGRRWGVKLTYVLQEKPIGLANIIYSARRFIGRDKFLLHLFHGDIRPLVEKFAASDLDGLLTVVHHPENRRLGVPFFDKKGRLLRLVEKPANPPHDLAIPGLYFAGQRALDCFRGPEAIEPSARGEYEITDVFQWLIDRHYRVETMVFEGVWRDPGKFDDWLETNRFLLDRLTGSEISSRLGKDVKVTGAVKIGRHCRIKSSVLKGPLVIGDRVCLEDAVIGPHVSIDDDCAIAGSRLANTILMKKVSLDHLSRPLNNSLIGEESRLFGNTQSPKSEEMFVGSCCVLKL